MLYRIVADEFVIVDFMGGTVDEACALYVRIRQQLQQFVEDNHYEVVFTISGGILNCADVWEKSYSNIMKISEFALNEAKRNGKTVTIFSLQRIMKIFCVKTDYKNSAPVYFKSL